MDDLVEKTNLMHNYMETRKILDRMTVSPQYLRQLVQPDLPLHDPDHVNVDLGELDILVTNDGKIKEVSDEIILNILRHADIATLLEFRRVNRRAHTMVNDLPEWRKIIQRSFTSDIVGMIDLMGSARNITVAELYQKLRQTTCNGCGEHASSLDVLDLARRCLDQQRTFGMIAAPFLKPGAKDMDVSTVCLHTTTPRRMLCPFYAEKAIDDRVSCWRKGFDQIASLKQHLVKEHRVPKEDLDHFKDKKEGIPSPYKSNNPHFEPYTTLSASPPTALSPLEDVTSPDDCKPAISAPYSPL
ncbi:hypothetical protein E8E11_001593 [Didymella keratinophila]|nr:hypothetical protein E8E11_001593 [Didymella keratinophila]